MARFTLDIPDELNNQIMRLALLNHRSKNQHIAYILERFLRDNDTPRYQLGKDGLCHNGVHFFGASEVSTKDMCNCGMYTYGELK